jgi:hypothetical protein
MRRNKPSSSIFTSQLINSRNAKKFPYSNTIPSSSTAPELSHISVNSPKKGGNKLASQKEKDFILDKYDLEKFLYD